MRACTVCHVDLVFADHRDLPRLRAGQTSWMHVDDGTEECVELMDEPVARQEWEHDQPPPPGYDCGPEHDDEDVTWMCLTWEGHTLHMVAGRPADRCSCGWMGRPDHWHGHVRHAVVVALFNQQAS